MAWYKDGQVTVQSGSRTVVGVGTAWLKQVMAGEGLDVLDGRLHEVAEVISNTELLLVDAYAGVSAAGVAYQIIPSASMTKELTRRVNLLVATHEEMTAGVQQAYASTLENAAKVEAVTEQVEGDAQAAAASAQSASESQAAAHADSDAAMGYRNEARAARDAAGGEAAGAAQANDGALLAMQQAVAARDAAGAYAQSIDPAALRERANHTGTQSMETVDGLPDALGALGVVAAKAVQQTSATGMAVLPEGPSIDSPDPLPEEGLLVRGNSTTGKPEWYDRSKSAWQPFGADIANDVTNLATKVNATNKTAQPDLIINGLMEFSERGASFAGITASSSAYFLDRWTVIQAASTAVGTIAQVSGAAFDCPYALRYTVTTADASTAAGHVVSVLQKIEGFRVAHLVSKPFTFRFKVKSPKTGKHCVAFKNSGGDRSYIAEFTVTAANTVEEKIITLPGLPTTGTWDFATGMGLAVGFILKCGATYQTTAGAWQTGDFWGSAGTANVCDAVGNVFEITDVHLHAGDATAIYYRRMRDEERTLCRRYLPVITGGLPGSFGMLVGVGQAVSTILVVMPLRLGVPARVAGSGLTLMGPLSAYTCSQGVGSLVPATNMVVDAASSPEVVTLQLTFGSGFTAGSASYMLAKYNILVTGCEL